MVPFTEGNMATGKLKIHTENILPIIKQWLYSDKDIFVRELVSNACDAIQKCKVLREHGQIECSDEEFRIDIQIAKSARTLTFCDNGIGMTSEEVEKYIAQVAFSGAEEFIGKYSSQNEKDQIIGHFGLGFYSSYMVAEKVTINTKSYSADAPAALWTCDGSSSYTLDPGSKETRGTEITLFVDKDNEDFLEESRLRSILQQYCAFLPFPIYLNGTQVNKKQPLWLKNPSECTTEAEYLEFYHSLYPLEPPPIFWVHLNIDYPFNLKGILYFPKITKRFDWGHNTIKLFCNRVFVSDNCKELIPDYLMILRGAIDSPDIPLNVSRSTLQMDRTVRQLSQHISKKVSDRLSTLYTSEREKFLQCWPDIEMIIKLGMLQDDKFYERSKEFLVWKNLSGEWTTAAEYLARNKEAYKGKIFYTSEEQESHVLSLYTQKGIEVLTASSSVDTPLITLLEDKLDGVKFQRTDGAIDSTILDTSREKTLLDADGRTEAFKIADFIRSKLNITSIEVEAKSLHSDSLPALLVVDEEMRRMRETLILTQQQLPPSFAAKRTFVVNTNNKLVQSIYRLKEKDPALAQEMVHHLYELSLLSQRELEPASLSQFIARSNQILEKMAHNL